MPSPDSLRVLFLASRDEAHPEVAGGDLQLSGLAAGLASRGHRITYACIRRPGVPAVEIRDDVMIVRGPGARSQAAWAAWMYAREWSWRTDVVVEEAVGGLPVPYAAPVYVRQPLVAFWYQVNAPLFRAQFSPVVAAALTSLERGLARLHATAIIATPSAFQAARLRRLGFRPGQVRIVPIGLDWPAAPPPPLSARESLIVYLGRLRRYKCPHHLLAVAQRLDALSSPAKIVIAGRPDRTGYDRWLETEIMRLGLQGRVTLTRSISDEAKRDLVRRARVLVVPSPAEGFGFVVLEAHWGGTPVVATTGAPSEVIQEGRNGLRVPFGDTAALAAAIVRLLHDDAQWTRMSRGAWDSWHRYPWAAATPKLEAAMTEAIRRQRERRASEPHRAAPRADAAGRGLHRGAPRSRRDVVTTARAPAHPVRDCLYNAAWSFGVQIRDLLKRRFGGILPDDALARIGSRLLPPPDEETEISLFDGQRVAIPPRYPFFRGLATRVFERDVVAYVSGMLKAGMTVVDLGANIGYYTLLASRLVGPSGVVYAFEPDPLMFEYLTRNIARNHCANVIAMDVAVTDRIGTASFVSSERVRGWVALAPAGAQTPAVKTVTLDVFFAARGWPPIHLIKVDVEGSEQSALEGMAEVCARNPGLQLIVEYNLSTMRRAGVTPEALGKTLGALGFATGYAIEQGFKPFSTGAAFPKPAICNLLFVGR